METFIKAVSSFITMSQRMIFAAVIFTGLCLFTPAEMIGIIGVNELVDEYHSMIGIFFLISTSISVVNVIVYFSGFVKEKWSNFNYKRKRKKILRNLEEYELAIVKLLYNKDNHTDFFDLSDGAVSHLVACQIIYRTSNTSTNYDNQHLYFPYTLNSWANSYIKNSKLMKEKLATINVTRS